MTDPTPDITIGPLTATEWASFFLPDDDPRNPLPACCAEISFLRDNIAYAMRAGGDPMLSWREIARLWPAVDSHLNVPMTDPQVPAPLRKLWQAYVQDRPDPGRAEEAIACMVQENTTVVTRMIKSLTNPQAGWDLDSPRGQWEAVVRVANRYVSRVYDPAERTEMIQLLADTVGMSCWSVALIVETLREVQGLPWQPISPPVPA